VLIVVVTLILAACVPAKRPALTPITIQLKWTHAAQFGGFYAADQKGYYAAQGLAAAFVEGGPGINVLDAVAGGSAQFGVAGASDLILARAQGKPLRALAVIYRRNPNVWVALESTGITRPQDFVGKKIRSVSDMPPMLHAMTARVGVCPDQYTEVELPSDVALFGSGEVPIWGIYAPVLGVAFERAGYRVNGIYPDDYGVHFYGDVILATDAMVAQNPELVRRFLRATLDGWRYAVENPADTGPMVGKVSPNADPELQVAQMTSSIPFIQTGEDQIGWMKAEVWAGMEKVLREQGVLTKTLEVSQVYDAHFMPELRRP
jgi:ABC-type nitrate/sulfonate/bicarbonate transport system substrate-binding protein